MTTIESGPAREIVTAALAYRASSAENRAKGLLAAESAEFVTLANLVNDVLASGTAAHTLIVLGFYVGEAVTLLAERIDQTPGEVWEMLALNFVQGEIEPGDESV